MNSAATDSTNSETVDPNTSAAASDGWNDPIKYISITLSILVFVKNVTTWTIFMIRRYIEQREDVALRP